MQPRSNVSFGQAPRPNPKVIPTSGTRQVSFYFTANGFDERSNVAVQIVDPHGNIVYNTVLTADNSGSIDGFKTKFDKRFENGKYCFVSGNYRFFVTGFVDRKQVREHEDFELVD